MRAALPSERRSPVAALRCTVAALALSTAFAGPARAQVDGFPLLDNETIGLTRAVAEAVEGPVEQWDEEQWGVELLQAYAGGDAMSPFRYLIAFPAYSVAQTAAHTPAWREPYRLTLDRYIGKMAEPLAWEDFVTEWGGASPMGPDNIMYTGHLVYMMTLYRQLFDDPKYESTLVLTGTDGATYETDVHALTDWIATQAGANVASDGTHYYGVPCEPGRVFVPCNTPHRVSELVYDDLYGTDHAADLPTWLSWVEAEMVDADSGVLFDLYWPYGRHQGTPSELAPEREPRLSGVYNAWTIWYFAALDREWGEDLYPAYTNHFVVRGEASPFPDGRTLVLDEPGVEGPIQAIMNIVATGFGMPTARAYGDEALADELAATWDAFFGPAQWDADGATWAWTSSALPLVFQNSFPLLARTTSGDQEIRLAMLGQDRAELFAQPYVAALSDELTFVNQAIYDPKGERLIVTVNGGAATTSSVDIEIANVDPMLAWSVTRDGEPYGDHSWADDRLVIHTPPLGSQLESYIVQLAAVEPTDDDDSSGDDDAGDPPIDDCACAAGSPRGAAAGLLFTIGLLAGVRRRETTP